MCVRYAAYQINRVIDLLGIKNCAELDAFKDNYNASPGQYLPIVTCQDKHTINLFKWGLISPWYKTGITAANMFNIEAAKISKRPVLRSMLKSQRCIIVTSGYYEWKSTDNGQIAYHVRVKEEPFTLLAGLYEASVDKRTGERMNSFTIITTKASAALTDLRADMPLTLVGDDALYWLSEDSSVDKINELLFHDARHEIDVYEVSAGITDSRTNLPGLIVRI